MQYWNHLRYGIQVHVPVSRPLHQMNRRSTRTCLMYSIHSSPVRLCPGISFIKSSTICVSCETASSRSICITLTFVPFVQGTKAIEADTIKTPWSVQNVSHQSSWCRKVCTGSTSICMATYHVYHSANCINSHSSAMPLPLMTAPMAPIYNIMNDYPIQIKWGMNYFRGLYKLRLVKCDRRYTKFFAHSLVLNNVWSSGIQVDER